MSLKQHENLCCSMVLFENRKKKRNWKNYWIALILTENRNYILRLWQQQQQNNLKDKKGILWSNSLIWHKLKGQSRETKDVLPSGWHFGEFS